jgi:L-lactate dehydrogenase complex protein LldG
MNAARDRIMASVRDGLLRAVLPDATADQAGRWVPPDRALPRDTLVEQFGRALTSLTGHLHHAATASAAADVIAGIAASHGATSYLSWDDEHLGCPGLLSLLESLGLPRVTYDVPGDPVERRRRTHELAEAGLGLTGAHAALADSGAIILVSGPGRGRLASLLPPVHVAIGSERRMWPSLPALVRAEPGLLDAGSNVVVVAGPSRTADIEMTLTHGVHGPKHVHVILMP